MSVNGYAVGRHQNTDTISMCELDTKKRVLIIPITIIGLFYSCAALPPANKTKPPKTLPMEQAELPPEAIPVRPEPSENIMGKGKVSGENLALFLEQNNPKIDSIYIRELAHFYIEEAAAEGVNHDIAFAQMCLETGFLKFGNLVQPTQNNFCGLGAIGPGQPGHTFPDPRTGVRAHVQHLQAYATEDPLNGILIDPRYKYVRRGSSPTIHGLSGTWAADKSYGTKIGTILVRLYDFTFGL